MADFSYVAYTNDGREATGSLAAPNVEDAFAELKRVGMTPLKVVEKSALSKGLSLSFLKPKPKPRDLAVFCRQFVSIIDAGVPIVSALEMLTEQTENKALGKIIGEVRLSVEKGASLTDSLRPHERAFGGRMFLSLIAAGEESGSLNISLTRMAEQYEKDMKLRAVIQKAAIYPIIILVLIVAVVSVMLVVVIPQFQSIFEQTGGELPGVTRFVVAASGFMQAWWWLVLAVIAAAVVGLTQLNRTRLGKLLFSRLVLRIPVVNNLVTKTASARMARTLSTLLGSGIPFIAALDIAADTMTNVLFEDDIQAAKDGVSLGNSLSEMIKKGGLFPPLVHQMTKIGEESGNIEEMLRKVADYYDEEVESATAQVMALVEPVLIIVMAAIVAVIVLSVMLPVAGMYETLENL